MGEKYTQEDYKKDFEKQNIKRNALRHALDTRKFEIDLYWKRATYFWAFIAATLAGYAAIQAIDNKNIEELSIIISCLGIIFSFSWFLANRGSKQWQENWEHHVDMLEDDITGPLFKVVLRRSESKGILESFIHLITGPSPFSVSKINQIISLYITMLWFFLLYRALPVFNRCAEINWYYVFIISATFIFMFFLAVLGRTYHDSFRPYQGTKRKASIEKDDSV